MERLDTIREDRRWRDVTQYGRTGDGDMTRSGRTGDGDVTRSGRTGDGET